MRTTDLTVGPIPAHLARMSIFIGSAMLLQSFYGLIDLYWVGRLGSQAIAAVAIGVNLMMITLALTRVLSVGTLSAISQAAGRKDAAQVQHILRQSLLLSLLISFFFAAILLATKNQYCLKQASNADTAALAETFLNYFIPAMALQFPLMTLGSALRGMGEMRIAAITSGGTILLNIVLAPLFIFGWGGLPALGVAGAALASLVAVGIGLTLLLTRLAPRRQSLTTRPTIIHTHHNGAAAHAQHSVWRPDRALWRTITLTGLPSGIEFGVFAGYFAFVIWITRALGPQAQAAFGIGMRIMQMTMLTSISIGFAASAIAGQNFGARLADRVRLNFKASLVLALLCAASLALPLYFFAGAVVAIFSHDPQVIAYGIDFLHFMAWNLLAIAINVPCTATFSGFGNTRPSMFGAMLRIGSIVLIGYGLQLRSDFNIQWIWKLSVAAAFGQAIFGMLMMRREFSKHLAPIEQELKLSTV